MEPEKEDGNIEYKVSLANKTKEQIENIASQQRYRVDEGSGEAIYVLGVSDEGKLVGLSPKDFDKSFENLSLAAENNRYSLTILSKKELPTDKSKNVYEILVRENNEHKYIDLNVAVAGNVDSGKTSLVGVLTSGKNDNGRGSARLSVFNFQHEVSSGRTSSVAQHILGFDSKGNITNYTSGLLYYNKEWPDIVKDSSKIISFYDLCGHEKYLKTTITGLSSSFPDLCLVLVGANMGITKITQEHIFLCVTLGIPFAIVITKIDICKNRKNVLKQTVQSINKLLKMPGLRKVKMNITGMDDIILCTKHIHSRSIVPVFQISNVTGQGIPELKKFLNLMRKAPSLEEKVLGKVEYHINTTFSVVGVGTVTGGQLVSGIIKVGDKLMLGPNEGKYTPVQVRSIHCKRVPLQSVSYGCYVCLGLRKIDRRSIRKGNVMVSPEGDKFSISEFRAEVKVLKSHSTTIKVGYEPVVHYCSVRQTATIIEITDKVNGRNSKDTNNDILRTGDKAIVKFKFKYQPEYIKKGFKILMAQGKVKVIGVVV